MEKGYVAFAGGRDCLLVSKCRENYLKQEWKYKLGKVFINQV